MVILNCAVNLHGLSTETFRMFELVGVRAENDRRKGIVGVGFLEVEAQDAVVLIHFCDFAGDDGFCTSVGFGFRGGDFDWRLGSRCIGSAFLSHELQAEQEGENCSCKEYLHGVLISGMREPDKGKARLAIASPL